MLFSVTFVFFTSLSLALGTLFAAQNLHNHLLQQILHCPLSFFDTTPVGRLINRFSSDVDVVDNTLPMNLRSWITTFYTVGLHLSPIWVCVKLSGIVIQWLPPGVSHNPGENVCYSCVGKSPASVHLSLMVIQRR